MTRTLQMLRQEQNYQKKWGLSRNAALIICLIACWFLLSSCGSSAEQLASTYTAQTMAAIRPTSPPTDTPVPSNTPLPTETFTPIPTATATLIPTDTPLPSDTPTITATPGPFSFFDDFTANSGGWEDCELCSWENGGLLMGPFQPTSNFHKNYCTGCGERTYYSIAVDATFVEGQVDRFFGVFVGDADGKQYYLGISPWQFYIIAVHTDDGDSWEVLDFQWSGAVKASYATNHFEVKIQPAYQPNTADYLFSLNGSTLFIIYGTPIKPSKAGLAMNWHAVTANYDNWEYLEIER
jgi:hypothetical protein